jgi:hypothetical protein
MPVILLRISDRDNARRTGLPGHRARKVINPSDDAKDIKDTKDSNKREDRGFLVLGVLAVPGVPAVL